MIYQGFRFIQQTLIRLFIFPVTSHQSPVTSPQSPVTSHQSPVPSPQSPVPSPQSPILWTTGMNTALGTNES
ncbi:hypothetical protein [Sphaerospermopsis sp. FACHB-1194]|uniref:hypothetical protein n=1 Tax=Sphaerospermopsis sp. FACHB-1194 TaxID=2692862 RepID=UPI001680AE36|nr:hypothetical protein [Sphaerospermopsis sp. FACHB-1194]MBD2146426.1 hypothetical protein [Sphaerospermopsis sp. FACHB-1194]